MAKSKNKSKNKEIQVLEEPTNVEGTEEELSPWYAFCSTGCGFCKKAEPVIEELNKEGYDILTLDLAEPDNKKLNEELKKEYGVQCGTPWFINAETGKGVCGFREKDVLKQWLDGKDIPEPPRPTGPPPKVPFHGCTDEELETWKDEYEKWIKDNEHMPNLQTVEQILSRPRPKSDPPRPPAPNSTDADIDKWGEEYSKWAKENSHLPNLQPVDQILQRFKQRNQQMPPGGQPTQPGTPGMPNNFENRLSAIESKLDALVSHLGVKNATVSRNTTLPSKSPVKTGNKPKISRENREKLIEERRENRKTSKKQDKPSRKNRKVRSKNKSRSKSKR